jgi:signal transduction histidine kinase
VTAQATLVVTSLLVAIVFWRLVPTARTIAWAAGLWVLAAARLALVRGYRRATPPPSEARPWARRFAAAAFLTGAGWGVAAYAFFVPGSPIHQLFLAFVLGGMAAGAASSNCTYPPAFLAYAVPALAPAVVRFAMEGDTVHTAMAFLLAVFGVAMGGIARQLGGTIEQALRLRFANEVLVEDLTEARRRLERANAELEERVADRTAELARTLDVVHQSDARKGEFIAVLSHELRNPLAAIRNSLYLLDHAAQDQQRSARPREIIERQTRHLARLVDDLLDVTRISRGKFELRPERLDAREVVRRICEDHRPTFEARGVALRVHTPDPAPIETDEVRFAQAVGNLLHNASKFTREGGAVEVRLHTLERHVEIRVRDEGVGIRPELLPHVFEPFVQAEEGLARTKGGLGLGLALVKGVVELSGGTVCAHSEGVGRGAEFVLTFPRTAAPERPVPAPATGRASPTRARGQVLVVEDNLDTASTLADVLALEGFRVEVATSGASGLAKARELKPDVILCDLGLPDVDGYEVARTIRADEALRATRLIAVSGYAQPEDRQRAVRAGFDAHIAKPPSIDALLAAVASG